MIAPNSPPPDAVPAPLRQEDDVALAHRRLEDLYAICKLFASFEDVEHTVDPALAIASQTLLLRSAILIKTDNEGHSRMIVWHSEPRATADLAPIKRHIEAMYTYLVGAESIASLALSEHAGLTPLPPQSPVDQPLAARLIVMPLVVARQAPFGALQLEGSHPFDKTELMFVNTIVNQLSIALDRDRAWRRDIARRERAEALADENAKLYEQAQEAVRMREQILTVVSHDLRNPLATILMTTSGVDKREPEQERRRAWPQALGRITRAAERMLRLIEDLLDFASIEEGRLAIARCSVDAASIAHEAVASFESAAQAKQIRLSEVVAPELPEAYCDRDRILQVLSNILSNANKITNLGGAIELRLERCERGLLFSVTDSGPGISEHDLQHLFERYWRGGQAEYKGSGLGLAIAKGIIVAHDGQIWAESELGAGATFSFTVPAVKRAATTNGFVQP